MVAHRYGPRQVDVQPRSPWLVAPRVARWVATSGAILCGAFGTAAAAAAAAAAAKPRLDFPRDDAAGLKRALHVLEAALHDGGLEPVRLSFLDCEWRAEVAAVAWIVAALCLAGGALRRSRRAALAALVLLAAGGVSLAGGFDAVLPRTERDNLQVRIEPRGTATREIVLTAHYDSKTEPFDHVQRAILGAAVLGLAFAATLAARRRWATRPWWTWATALGLAMCAVQVGAGRWWPERSPGAADNAAAALLLVDVARAAQATPGGDCRLTCVWFASEERGAQGSAAWVRQRLTAPDAAPRSRDVRVLNLECLGAGPELGVIQREWNGWRWRSPDLGIVAGLDAASPVRLHRFAFPSVTDAGACRRVGIAAATLVGLERGGRPPRHLHRAADSAAQIDSVGLRAARRTLEAFVAQCDSIAPTH